MTTSLKDEFVGFGIYDHVSQKLTKFDCTELQIKQFSNFCYIPNISNLLENNKDINKVSNNKQMDGIFCINGVLSRNQIGNNNLGKSNYKRNTFIFLYDPIKLYGDKNTYKFDYILESKNKSSFESGMSSPIYCGKKYGIIYESGFNLYQLKLENIKNTNIKFKKLGKSNVNDIFGKFNDSRKTRYSLNMIYLNKKNKLFAVRNYFSARDNRGRVNPPKSMKTQIICGIYDLLTTKWISCGNFMYEEKWTSNPNLKTKLIYDEKKNIIYIFCNGALFVKSYNLNKNEWISPSPTNLNKKIGHNSIIKMDKFNRVIRSYYFGDEKQINTDECDLKKKKLCWLNSEFKHDVIINDIKDGWYYQFI